MTKSYDLENKNIETMSNEDLKDLYDNILKNKNNKIFLKETLKVTQTYHNLGTLKIKTPDWFCEKTKFEDNIWYTKVLNKVKIINFSNIEISEEKKLVDFPKILNTFKYFICIQNNPIVNNGKIIKRQTLNLNIRKTINFINYILVNSEKIGLTKQGFSNVNEEFILDYLIDIASKGSDINAIKVNNLISKFLLDKIKNIEIDKVRNFEKTYPLVEENYNSSELNLTLEQIRKIRLWLFISDGYSASAKEKHSKKILIEAYKNKIIDYNQNSPYFSELNLFSATPKSEYFALPCKTNESTDYSFQDLQYHINLLKKINFLNYYNDCEPINSIDFSELSLRRVNKEINLRSLGRYATLPTDVVLDSLKNATEFIQKYMDIILETLIYFYSEQDKYINFDDYIASSKFPSSLKHIGIKKFTIEPNKNYFKSLRKNIGFFEFYKVLLGSILIVIGTITARRTTEILELDHSNALYPSPHPIFCENKEYEIIFENQKSGVGGLNYHREKLGRPITKFVARIIFKLQKFNKILLSQNIVEPNKIFLINMYSPSKNTWLPLHKNTYNNLLNIFCDYTKTKVIEYEENSFRRYYIRQHQLRRFFAMMFFWSKSFDGLDTLRYFLGHTDLEHLYHYVTEPITGNVLNGIKAHTLTESYLGNSSKNIKNIESLRDILLNHFNIIDIEISSFLKNNQFNQNNFYYDKFAYLISENFIDLKPYFYSYTNDSNQKVETFDLILIVKDTL